MKKLVTIAVATAVALAAMALRPGRTAVPSASEDELNAIVDARLHQVISKLVEQNRKQIELASLDR